MRYAFRLSRVVFAAMISADVLKALVKSPVEMKPTASRTCSNVRHRELERLTNSKATPPEPSGISRGTKLEKSRWMGELRNADRRYVGPVRQMTTSASSPGSSRNAIFVIVPWTCAMVVNVESMETGRLTPAPLGWSG